MSASHCETFVFLALLAGTIWGGIAVRVDLRALLRGKWRLKRFEL